MPYFPLEHQLVDVLTKWMNSLSLHDLVFKPGMKDIYFSALGGVLRCEWAVNCEHGLNRFRKLGWNPPNGEREPVP